MPTLAVVTTFPPNRWTTYAKRMIQSHVDYWPDDVKLYAYYEGTKPDFEHNKVQFVNIEEANPELIAFKSRHKDDPVANGETREIPGGVRRDPNAGKNDRGKGSYLWDAVRFAHKTFNEVAKNAFHSFIATFLLVLLGVIAAFTASLIIDKNFFTLLLSYCPGGIYEVAVIAIFFNLDPEFVSFHHIIRLLMILFIVPVILRFLK